VSGRQALPLIVCIVLGLGPARAGAAREVELAFVPPEVDGRVSFGIFDAGGKLVRTLFFDADFDAFEKGLNGLMTRWDGLDDAGNAMPAGQYSAHGYLVGDVKVEGEAYHFNDWVEDENSPRWTAIDRIALMPGGDLLVLGKTPEKESVLARYTGKGDLVWRCALPLSLRAPGVLMPPVPLLAANGSSAMVVGPGGEGVLVYVSAGQIRAVLPSRGDPPAALAISGSTIFSVSADAAGRNVPLVLATDLFTFDRGWLARIEMPGLGVEHHDLCPAGFTSLATTNFGLVAGSADRDGCWIKGSGGWARLDLPVRVLDLSAGPGDTFWMVGCRSEKRETFVGQFDRGGEFLRELKQDDGRVAAVTASASDDVIYVHGGDGGSGDRVRGLKRSGDSSGWKVIFERTFEPCSRFGFVGGRLVADAGGEPRQDSVEVVLTYVALDPRFQTLEVVARSDARGSYLAAKDGLPLLRVSDTPGLGRVILRKGKTAGRTSLFQGDGAVVEEFAIRGLSGIAAFDCGEFDLP